MPNSQKIPNEKDFYDGLIQAMNEGIVSGVGNFFSNMWIGAGRLQEDFLGFDDYDGRRAVQNINEDLRFVKAINNIIDNIDLLLQIVGIIIEDTMSRLSYQQRERVG